MVSLGIQIYQKEELPKWKGYFFFNRMRVRDEGVGRSPLFCHGVFSSQSLIPLSFSPTKCRVLCGEPMGRWSANKRHFFHKTDQAKRCFRAAIKPKRVSQRKVAFSIYNTNAPSLFTKLRIVKMADTQAFLYCTQLLRCPECLKNKQTRKSFKCICKSFAWVSFCCQEKSLESSTAF